MPDLSTNQSFQLWANNEQPWEHRSDFEKIDDIFSGQRTAIAYKLEDNSTDPSVDGEIRRNGSDVKIHSGGKARNLTAPLYETTTIEDTSTDPSTNGELRRNGTHLKAFSGGEIQNLTDAVLWESTSGGVQPSTAGEDVLPNGASALGTGSNAWPTAAIDDLEITEFSDNSTTLMLDSVLGSSQWVGLLGQPTSVVSTTATAIYTAVNSDGSGTGGHTIVVSGNSGGNYFTDIVQWLQQGSTATVNSVTRNSPAGRTYTVDGTDLDLAMASGTYSVAAVGMGSRW